MLFLVLTSKMRKKVRVLVNADLVSERERETEKERKQQSDSTKWMSWLNQILYKFAYKAESESKKAQKERRAEEKQNTLTILIYMALFRIELLID